MNKHLNLKNLALLMTVIAGIATTIGVISRYRENNPAIEIQNITSDKLTDLPKVEGLKAQFYYKDNIVNSLWKLNYDITNIGNKAIIGVGSNKNIIKEGLTFYLPENYKVLEVNTLQDDSPFELYNENNKVKLKFLQWKPKESLSIILYVEQLSNKEIPMLKTDEREILNGVVNYTSLKTEMKGELSLLDLLPRTIQFPLRWICYIVFGLAIVILPIVWISDFVKYINYTKWKKSNCQIYKKWINESIEKEKLESYYEPSELPKQYWENYPHIKPVLYEGDFTNMTVGIIILLFLTLIPLLIMIKI